MQSLIDYDQSLAEIRQGEGRKVAEDDGFWPLTEIETGLANYLRAMSRCQSGECKHNTQS